MGDRFKPESVIGMNQNMHLEVVDEENASTVWDDPFDTDREALDEVMEVIERDGIRSFLEGDSGVAH